MQCQETCRMATETINLLDEGGMQECNCNYKGTESIQNLCPLLPVLWSNAFSLGNQIHNKQLLLVCPNNVWPGTQGVKLKARYSRVGAINTKRSTQWKLPKLYTCATITGCAKDVLMEDTSKVQSAHDPTNYCRRCGLAHEAFHNESTHATPIVSQYALRAVWATHQ